MGASFDYRYHYQGRDSWKEREVMGASSHTHFKSAITKLSCDAHGALASALAVVDFSASIGDLESWVATR